MRLVSFGCKGTTIVGKEHMMEYKKLKNFGISMLTLLFISTLSCAAAGDTTQVSIATDGTKGDLNSATPSVSADGRYIAFSSAATNLITGGSNGASHIYLHDTQTGETLQLSVASDGTEGNSNSYNSSITSDGRYVVFESYAENLVTGDTNNQWDIFVRDTQLNTTIRVSIATDGTQGNGGSHFPSISDNGRYVTFSSEASNLVTGDTNHRSDIFLHDIQTDTTIRVSVASNGTQGNEASYHPSISSDGRYIAFSSFAENLVTGDTNTKGDIFIHDTQTDTTSRISIATDGTQGDGHCFFPYISADGHYVAFGSDASTLVTGDNNGVSDIFLHDIQTGTTTLASIASDGTEGDQPSHNSSISEDGRYVAFHSSATTLVVGDTNGWDDVFVHDTRTGITTRVSIASNGTEGNGQSDYPSISDDAHYVAFSSYASNLSTGDTNNQSDVFIHQYLPDANAGGGCSYNPNSQGFDLILGLLVLLGLLYPIRSRFLH